MSQPVSYAEIKRQLAEANATSEPAEAHGALAGSLCTLSPYGLEDWLGEILPERISADRMLELRALYESTVQDLFEGQMAFQLLLPDDEDPIEERTEALTLWCTGFIYGLGSNGVADPAHLPGAAAEIVRDLVEITRAGVDAREALDTNEQALAELIEYVRVGVQLVFEEMGALRAAPLPARQSLH